MNGLIYKLKESPPAWLILGLLLTILGLMALYSISLSEGVITPSSRFFRQVVWLLPALGAYVVFLGIPRRMIHKYAYLAFLVTFGLLFVPYLSGPVAGTYRWISLGGLSFQPSEIMKWVVVIALARYLSDYNLKITRIQTLFVPIILILIPALVVARQPDIGSALILVAPILPLLYWVGARPLHIFLLIAPLVSVLTAFSYYTFTPWIVMVAVVLYLAKPRILTGLANFFANIFIGLLTPVMWGLLKPYQQERLLVLFNPTEDPQGAAYQIIQSQTAIGSGGFLGKGLTRGTQTHLKFLPEQETDFIFSVIGEELGFIVVSIILILFAVMVMDLIRHAFRSGERFSSLVLVGIATLFLCHIFVNIGMTINLLPVKGLPLPFMSYGGSFLVSCYAMIGLAGNMAVETPE
ncbi:MAG: FtsW/RodA/SpoVE family cell cycle protein [Fidelibacterota bacterium]